MNIEVTLTPSQSDLATISEGIKSFNSEYLSEEVVSEPDTKFAAFVRNENGVILGGIRATAFWNYCLIELLWLSESYRGSGIGSGLINAAESFARAKGYENMRIETLSFQAKPFYEKLGYKVFGELPDYPKGHTTYCLVKKL